ncbi:hypothetical protein ACOMHN_022145 [Nucella lapillus]
MGSGSSKEEKKKDPVRDTKKDKPVANVNNQDTRANNNSVSAPPQTQTVQQTFITQPDDSSEKNNRINTNGKEPTRRDEDNSWEVPARKRTTQDGFVWQADRETQDELNEVLQIPTDNKQTSRSVNSYNPVKQQDLPETYAQRKQREQYTLNQQMLLRQKTIYRNPDDWTNEDEEESSGTSGFDPSKFRSVNMGQPVKSTVFTTNARQDGGIQYMSGQQTMDEFDVMPRHQDIPKNPPVYNQSEQDLMASLERELM